jgi:hypothetical protein
MEAWQDFINLKGRMDTELAKVTKRNNYLVEELESWKQQVSVDFSKIHMPFADFFHSFSNSRLSPNNSPRKRKSSKPRSRLISGRTAGWPVSLISRRMIILVSLFA